MEALREKFLNIYANIPIDLRSQVILVFEGKPITWDVVYLEVKTNTERSTIILSDLKELQLI